MSLNRGFAGPIKETPTFGITIAGGKAKKEGMSYILEKL